MEMIPSQVKGKGREEAMGLSFSSEQGWVFMHLQVVSIARDCSESTADEWQTSKESW